MGNEKDAKKRQMILGTVIAIVSFVFAVYLEVNCRDADCKPEMLGGVFRIGDRC